MVDQYALLLLPADYGTLYIFIILYNADRLLNLGLTQMLPAIHQLI